MFNALALIGDPELVVLDELTSGLDPQARRTTWDLVRAIRDCGRTVVLVTHLMDEAEQLCDRVAIIDHGRIVALDTPSALIQQTRAESEVRFSAANDFDPAWLQALQGVSRAARDGDQIVVYGDGPLMARVATVLADCGLIPPDLCSKQATLEDVFLELTSQRIRD